MQLIAKLRSVDIVSDPGPIAQAEHLPTLLTNGHTRRRESGTIALSEFLRIRECLDGCSELFCRNHVQVLDVVRILRRRFSAGRRLSDCRKTIPSETSVIHTRVVRKIQNSMVYTSLI